MGRHGSRGIEYELNTSLLTKSMRGPGMRTRVLDKARRARLKARRKKSSNGKSLLSRKESSSDSGESAVVHRTQMSLLSFSDEPGKGDNDPAVVRTVETLSVAGSDGPASAQEKEARSGGGILS
jgi:hypothetical protein